MTDNKQSKELTLNDVVGLNVKGFNFKNLSSGFVVLNKSMFLNPMFKNMKYCQGFAFCWLIANASYEFEEYWTERAIKPVTNQRGQISIGYKQLSNIFNWDNIMKVKRFLEKLEKAGTIKRESTPQGTKITIHNFDLYQDVKKAMFINDMLKSGKLIISIDGTLQAKALNECETNDKQTLNKCETDVKQMLTLKETKETKEIKKEEKTPEKSGGTLLVEDQKPKPKKPKSKGSDKKVNSIDDIKKMDLNYPDVLISFMEFSPVEYWPKTENAVFQCEDVIRKLEKDGHSINEIKDVIRWGRCDESFWQGAFKSIMSLRNKSKTNGLHKYINIRDAMRRDLKGFN
jgi:hypothetical protein